MRVGFVLHGYPPVDQGGVELVVAEQVAGLTVRGHDSGVFARVRATRHPDGTMWKEDVSGTPVWRVVNEHAWPERIQEIWRHDRLDAAFDRYLDEFRPQIVHLQHLILLSTSFARILRSRAIPYVVSLHDSYMICHRTFLLDQNGQRCDGPDGGERCRSCLAEQGFGDAARERLADMGEVLESAAAITVPARSFIARHVAEFPSLEGRLEVFPQGLAWEPGPCVAGNRQSRGGPVRILFCATIVPHKGLDLLLAGLAELPTDSWRLAVWGTEVEGYSGYLEELREAARSLPVTWCGVYEQADRDEIYGGADVLVLPSRCDESYSRVLDEARRAGLAIVAPATGGPGERFSDGVDAVMFDPNIEGDVRRAVHSVVEDTALRHRIAAAPFVGAAIDRDVQRLEEIYAGALASG